MLVPGAANSMLLAANAQYQISRSVRARASASAYFNRTPASAGNQQKWTWSAWVKRGALGASGSYETLFGTGTGTAANGYGFIRFDNNDVFTISSTPNGATSSIVWTSTPVYRDPSAWYHVMAVLDTTQATAANRFILYINGVSQAGSFSTTPTQNANIEINRASAHQIFASNASAVGNFFDGYMAEVNFIDGQALTPSSFGENNAVTGVWQPKKYSGSYGTNGFYLNFSDPSAATAAAIGKDSSGNGNNWTPNNISVTAGTTYDSMIDVPTPYSDGTVYDRGNYPVINPLKNGGMTISAANMLVTAPGAAWYTALSTMAMQSGVYWESTVAVASANSNYHQNGIAAANASITTYLGFDTNGWGITTTNAAGAAYVLQYNNGTTTITGATGAVANGDVWMYAYKNNKFYWGKNGTWYPTGSNPATETSPVASGLPNEVFAAASMYGTASSYFNFGQRPFIYTPPSGFVAMNTYNMTAATINNGAKYMAATLWTGDGANPRTITNTVNGVSFKPDLVWTKARNTAYDNSLYDSVRGATNYLISNSTAADASAANTLQAFNTDGFQVGGNNYTNSGSVTYVGWQWQAGAGTTSSNTSGTITSTVCAGTTQGCSVVTYTGTGANATVGHGLGVAPSMIIAKHRNAIDNWIVYHTSLGGSPNYVWLNLTSAAGTSATVWNTAPTSSVFGVGTDNLTNASGGTYVAYCFAAVKGFSAFGSYAGNASANGPFIYTGFRPRYILLKNSSAIANWIVEDTSRSTYNVTANALYPNLANAEDTSYPIDILSNGFKIRSTDAGDNGNGNTIIYAAFAENPFNISLAR